MPPRRQHFATDLSVAVERLVLFDIDGTLLDTGGAGGAALLDAVEELYSVSRDAVPALNLAGATDHGVIRELCGHVRMEFCEEAIQRFLAAYLVHLQRRLSDSAFRGRTLPGVLELLQVLGQTEGVHLGLLTGNVRLGAMLKLARFGIDSHFLDGAFGDDAEDRNLLGAVAVNRLSAATGHIFADSAVIVIGDTPKDIACARAIGARCIAVGTGVFTTTELLPYQPWQCLESLAETHRVCDLVLS